MTEEWLKQLPTLIDEAAALGGTICVPNERRKKLTERAIDSMYPESNIPVRVEKDRPMRIDRD